MGVELILAEVARRNDTCISLCQQEQIFVRRIVLLIVVTVSALFVATTCAQETMSIE